MTGSKSKPTKVARSPPPAGTIGLQQTTPPFPPDDLQHCHWSTTPACLRALYNFTVADPSVPVSPENSLGLYETYDVGEFSHILCATLLCVCARSCIH